MIQTPSGPIYVPDSFPGLPAPIAPQVPGIPGANAMPLAGPAPDSGFLHPDVMQGLGFASSPPQQTTPDYTLPPMQEAKIQTADAAATRTYDKSAPQRARDAKQQAQRTAQAAAYNASPEGRIEGADRRQADTLRGQEQVALARGEVDSAQADRDFADLDARNAKLNGIRDAQQAQEAARAKGQAEIVEKYQKAADAEAKYKIDDNRRWDNAGTGHQILAGIAVVMSGIGEALQGHGGKNPALDMITAAIHDDVNAQVREREQLGKIADRAKNSIDSYRQMTGDLREAGNLKIAEEYKRTADQMEATAQKYANPKAKLAAAATAGELRMRADALLGASAKGRFDRDMQRDQMANQQKQTAIAGGHLALAGKQFGLEQDKFKWEKQKDATELDLKAQALTAKGDPKAAENLQKYGIAGVTVKDKDGTEQPFIAQGTPESVEKVREIKQSATSIVGLIDEAKRIRSGWTTSSGNSEEWQKLQAIWAANKGVAKNLLQLGALSGSDYELMDGFLGTADPTKFRDPTAGMDQARKNVLRLANDSLHSHGLPDTQTWDIPDVQKDGPKETPGDRALERVLGDPSDMDSVDVARDLGGNPFAPGSVAAMNPDTIAARQKYQSNGGMLTGQRETLDNFAAMAKSTDPKIRDLGLSNLVNATQKAALPGVRDYAQQLLTNQIQPPTFSEDQRGSARNVSSETAPGAPR